MAARLGHRVDVPGQFVAVEAAAQLDRAARRLRVGEPAAGLPLAEHPLVAQFVVVGRAAQIARGNLLQLAPGVHRAGVIGARHRVRGLRPTDMQVHGRPWLVLPQITSTRSHGIAEHVGGHAGEVDHRMRPEIADARLHVQLAVGTDGHQPVVTHRARAMRADGHADAAHLAAAPLTGSGHAFGPAELLRAAIERLLHERAGHVAPLSRSAAGGPNGAFPSGEFIRRIATWSRPSALAALVITGSMMPLACIGPGERCCVRGGVFVNTLTARHRIAPG